MHDLIAVFEATIGGELQQAVNLREIHAKVQSKQDFSTWAKARLEACNAVEGRDFIVHKFMDDPRGRQATIDYHVTIDIAKHCAMLERNEHGFAIRQYLIDVEKRARSGTYIPNDPRTLKKMLIASLDREIEKDEQLKMASSRINDMAPKVHIYDTFMTRDGVYAFQDTGRLIAMQPGCPVATNGPNKFCDWLCEQGYTFRRENGGLTPKVEMIHRGWMVARETTDRAGKSRIQGFCTPKGVLALANKLLPKSSYKEFEDAFTKGPDLFGKAC